MVKISDNNDFIFKLLLFGDGGVGKTTLAQRYIHRKFPQSSRLTIGVDIYTKIVQVVQNDLPISVKLQIWDFGGEERFRFILPPYCEGADGGLFLFDVTRASTIEQIVDWLRIVHAKSGHIPVIMVAAKIDKTNERQISERRGIEMSKNFKMDGYIETSSKTGDNVDTVFQEIAELMVNRSRLFSF